MVVTRLKLWLVSPGFRIPPGRRVRVEHGAARVVRAGGGVEGPGRRRRAALPRLHVRQLVLRVVVAAVVVAQSSQTVFMRTSYSVAFVKNLVSVLSSRTLCNFYWLLYQWIIACPVNL